MTYKQKINYQNIQLGDFEVEGEYDIPVIKPVSESDLESSAPVTLLGFNYALSEKNPTGKALHFYLDDYQFERLWNNPSKYLNVLSKFQFVLSPDFSLFTDFPVALNIYNHYRKHWLAAYWQANGFKVVPTICWSDRESYKYCFDGEPKNSVVSVSSVGPNFSKASRKAFIEGYEEMERRLQPTKVLFYGSPVVGLERDNIIYVQNEQVARLRKIEVKKGEE